MTNEPNPSPYSDYPGGTPGRPKRLMRSRTDRKLAGVCGGAAEYLGIDPTVARLLMVAAAVFSGGAAVLVYLAGWVLMPEQ